MSFRSLGAERAAYFNSAKSCNFLDNYSKYVDRMIAEKSSEVARKTFAPSSFRCSRRQWFRLRGVEPDKADPSSSDKYLEFSAEMGTACHRIIQSNLASMLGKDWIDVGEYLEDGHHNLRAGWSCRKSDDSLETFIETSVPPIRFACDGLIRIDEEVHLLEIKTAEFSTFGEITGPKEKHIDQVNMYCALLGLKTAIFIYQDRQYGALKCYEYKVPFGVSESILRKMEEIQKLAEYNICPEPLPKGDSWCTRAMCPYFETCIQYGR